MCLDWELFWFLRFIYFARQLLLGVKVNQVKNEFLVLGVDLPGPFTPLASLFFRRLPIA